MYNNHQFQSRSIDDITLLENNFSNKIDEIHSLLDSTSTQVNINNMGPQFKVYFSNSKDNTQYYVAPCTQEYDLQSCSSFSNPSSSNSSSAYTEPNRCAYGETNRYIRDNENFKKYPLRSDKTFNVVPNLVDVDISKETISLKALSIGPDFYYKSDCHTIMDKMKSTVNYLEILSIDRDLLETLVSKFNSNYQLSMHKSTEITMNEAPNIKMYYFRLINLLETEYVSLTKICVLLAYMSQTVLSNLITDSKIRKITVHEEKDFHDILNDYLNAMNNLKKLHNLRIIRADNFNQFVAEDEKEQIIAALDQMIFAIRQWHIMLWTIKEGICMIEITSAEQIEHFRNLYIQS